MPTEEEWQTLARAGRRLWAAKVLAAQTGMGMEAHFRVEDWFAKNCLPPAEAAHLLCCLAVRRVLHRFAAEMQIQPVFLSAATGADQLGRGRDGRPDIKFWTALDANKPPDLAVVVVFQGDTYTDVQARMRRCFREDSRMVWVVDPESRIVIAYRPTLTGRRLEEADTLTGEDVLPGFSCKVADLFG